MISQLAGMHLSSIRGAPVASHVQKNNRHNASALGCPLLKLDAAFSDGPHLTENLAPSPQKQQISALPKSPPHYHKTNNPFCKVITILGCLLRKSTKVRTLITEPPRRLHLLSGQCSEELGTRIAIHDVRRPNPLGRIVQRLKAEACVRCVRESPRQNHPRVPVHDRLQIKHSAAHWQVSSRMGLAGARA